MSDELRLRPAQAEILAYDRGRMAVSAVPGSGKTFTLSLLAAQLIADGRVNPDAGQQVLIVTYLNASVDTFRARIRRRLDEMGLPDAGYDVRTLHSLALEILRFANDTPPDSVTVLSDAESKYHLAAAVDGWINDHPDEWLAFLPDNMNTGNPQVRTRWRDSTEATAAAFVRVAKNGRHSPDDVKAMMRRRAQSTDEAEAAVGRSALLSMLSSIYARYHTAITRQGGLDYDDLIWLAADRLEREPEVAGMLRERWPTVLEDEAQDSVPLQEVLLESLTGPDGNWVRVGDPNQAITSTFTAAHPRFFNAFIDRSDVVDRPLPNSGRSAPLIMGAANRVLDWTIDKHPVPEVRENTFRRQAILATPPGDAQRNPPDSDAELRIRVYRHRDEDELPAVAGMAAKYVEEHPEQTVAILVPTNLMGFQIADHLDLLKAPYDNLLRGSGREREVAAVIYPILALLADPLSSKALLEAHAGLYALHDSFGFHPAIAGSLESVDHFETLLRSIRPETLLFPEGGILPETALPDGIASAAEIAQMETLAAFLRRMFALRSLPIDDLALALADNLFQVDRPVQAADVDDPQTSHELDLAIAYQIAGQLRQWREAQPEWRLPELVAQLQMVALGQRSLRLAPANEAGFEPAPGRISLATQHGSKGLEWDAVFLAAVDSRWFPGSLEAPFQNRTEYLGEDLLAEAAAQLRFLMSGESGVYPGHSATDSARIELISERLRLLYVGITRARRYLHISRSRLQRSRGSDMPTEPATIMGVLYQYVKGLDQKDSET